MLREPVYIETVGGMGGDYYRVMFPGSTVTTTYALNEAAALKARVAGQKVRWRKGWNLDEWLPMSEEKFDAMVANYEEA